VNPPLASEWWQRLGFAAAAWDNFGVLALALEDRREYIELRGSYAGTWRD
jgi:hypothetical protein